MARPAGLRQAPCLGAPGRAGGFCGRRGAAAGGREGATAAAGGLLFPDAAGGMGGEGETLRREIEYHEHLGMMMPEQ